MTTLTDLFYRLIRETTRTCDTCDRPLLQPDLTQPEHEPQWCDKACRDTWLTLTR